MIIPILKNDAAYVRRVDAESRVAIWLVNHINSHEISKLGLTHIPGGAIDATGLIKLYTSYPGLIANTTHYVQGFCPAVPQLNPLIAVTRDYLITPNATLQMATGNGLLLDCVYAAKKLNLFNKNMDALSGPNLIRVLRYPLSFPIGFNMHCYDVDDSFKGVYILVNDSVFELKCFKYYYSSETYTFLFKPQESAIFVPQNCAGMFTFDANIAYHNQKIGWICTAGGEKTLDWRIIERFGKNASIVWLEYRDDQLRSKNNFAEAFAFVTQAKKRSIAMKIVHVTVPSSADAKQYCTESMLDEQDIKKLARKYQCKLDPIWGDLPGEIFISDMPAARIIPPFWCDEAIAAFVGKKCINFLKKILVLDYYRKKFKRLLIIAEERTCLLLSQHKCIFTNTTTRLVKFEEFNNGENFNDKVLEQFDTVFIVIPDGSKKILSDKMFAICSLAGITVGIFMRKEYVEDQFEEWNIMEYQIRELEENSFCVKDMRKNEINRYTFDMSEVDVTPSDENEMHQGK